jgi:hypothetical protein
MQTNAETGLWWKYELEKSVQRRTRFVIHKRAWPRRKAQKCLDLLAAFKIHRETHPNYHYVRDDHWRGNIMTRGSLVEKSSEEEESSEEGDF